MWLALKALVNFHLFFIFHFNPRHINTVVQATPIGYKTSLVKRQKSEQAHACTYFMYNLDFYAYVVRLSHIHSQNTTKTQARFLSHSRRARRRSRVHSMAQLLFLEDGAKVLNSQK